MIPRLAALIGLLMVLAARPASPQVAGRWNGVLRAGGIELEVVIRFEETDSGVTGLLDVPAQGQTSLPLSDISFHPPDISFLRMTSVGTLTFEGRLQGDAITGRIRQSGIEGTFALARAPAGSTGDPSGGNEPESRPDLDRTFLEPCTVPGVGGSAYCGRYRVPENRSTGTGRTIDLNVVLLPAAEPDSAAGPVFFLAGGPGGAATQLAPAVGVLFPDFRRSYDVVLIDQRGTGGSNPLQCAFADFDQLARAMLVLDVDKNQLVACRDGLDADLGLYGTHLAMDDLDDVRAALGYERINLYGISYGTRAALVYARRHPERVRTMTLQGVAPPSMRLPNALATDQRAALDLVLRACADDRNCRTHFGDVFAQLDDVMQRLRRQPVEVASGSRNPNWGGPLRITDAMLAGALRIMLYTGAGAGRIPGVIASAANGDFTPLVEAIRPFLENLGSTLHFGLFLSVTCAEDVPGVDFEAIAAAWAGTLLGDRAARNHQRLCRHWPVGAVPPGYHQPVRSDVPTLLISGSADPVTPPRHAHDAASHLSHSLELTVPNAGHADAVTACESGIIAAFIAAGTTEGLDTGCVAPRPRTFPAPAGRRR